MRIYYLARLHAGLEAGGEYAELPTTTVLSIVKFRMFDWAEFRSSFSLREDTHQAQLRDDLRLVYYELPKLPPLPPRPLPGSQLSPDELLVWWLWLFRVQTEEDMAVMETSGWR